MNTDRWKNTVCTRLLDCPDCNGKLSGLETDRLFFCRQCAAAFDMKDLSGDHSIPVTFANLACNPEIPVVRLPVWQFTVIPSDTSRLSVTVEPRTVHIFGFSLKRMQLYGNVYAAFHSALSGVICDGESHDVIGGELTENQAKQLVTPVILSLVRTHEVFDETTQNVCITESYLRAVPFYVQRDGITLPIGAVSIKRAMLGFDTYLNTLTGTSLI